MSDESQSELFSEVINALLDLSQPFPPKFLHSFSDLDSQNLQLLEQAWPRIETGRRIALMEDLEEIADADSLVYYDDIFEFALKDHEPRIRAAAIRMMWDSDNTRYVPALIDCLQNDKDEIVRASAASALGAFMYQGELDEIPEEMRREIENCLLDVMHSNQQKLIRRRALESLGFSNKDEVYNLIQKAANSIDKDWIVSALFAISRSADERWTEFVLKMIDHPLDEIKAEAIRAAGELELKSARYLLLNILEEPEALDEDVRVSTIWSLSKIGGEDVRETLEALLEDTEDDEEAGIIEQALENLEFTEGLPDLDLFDIDFVDEEELDQLIELDSLPDEEDIDQADDIL